MKREISRVKNGEFCTLHIELRDCQTGPELSICATLGRIETRKAAEKEALDYWISYFEDNPDAMPEMNRRFNRHFKKSTAAAKFVIATDGKLHGLDVAKEDGASIWISHSGGQCREEAERFFPGVKSVWDRWHLNGMRAGTAKQEEAIREAEKNGEVFADFIDLRECLAAKGLLTEDGHEYGNAWIYEPLPPGIIEWAKTFGAEEQ